jgi:mRNA-degrading endonuclease RelE of RelBE toxin-antitoxin system
MKWDAKLSEQAEKQFSRLPSKDQRIVSNSIDAMEADPFHGNVLKLEGKENEGRYRKRAGRWRIFFRVDSAKAVIGISAILPRNEKTYK